MNSALCRDELTVTQDRNEGRRGSEVELWIRICGWVPLRWSNQITRIMVDQMNRWIHSGQGFIGSFDLLIRVISDHWSWSRWSQRNAPIYLRISVECFHSRGQHLCKLIGTKESVYIRKEFNSHRIGSGHQYGPGFFWDTNMAALTSCENTGSISPFWFVLSTMIMSWENETVDAKSLEQNYWTFHYSTYFFTIPIILSQKLDLHPYKTIIFKMFSSNGVKGKVASFFSVYQVCVLRNKRKKKIKYSNANWLEVKIKWRRELSQEYALHFNQKRWFIHTNYNRTSISWNMWWPV